MQTRVGVAELARASARIVCFALIVAAPKVSVAQFIGHPPAALSEDEARIDEMRRGFLSAVPRRTVAELKKRASTADGLRSVLDAQLRTDLEASATEYCSSTWPNDVVVCIETLSPEKVAKWEGGEAPSQTRRVLAFKLPGFHRRFAVRSYLGSFADSGGTRIFGQFAANVSDNEAFVLTDVISGVAGRALFGIAYSAVVVKADTGSIAKRDTIETDKARLIRMVNAGGTVTARFAFPMHARQGPTFRHASTAVFNVGLVGPLGRSDSLAASGSMALEYVSALSIRDITERASQLGDLYLAVRVGPAISERPILLGSGHKSFLFGQLGIGLRQGNSVGLSALLTWLNRPEMREITPRLIVNFSAIR